MNALGPRLTRPAMAFSKQVTRQAPRYVHISAKPNYHPAMRPVFWTVSASVASGLGYAVSRSFGRIGGRFASRETRLNRDKWFKEGADEKSF